MMGLNRKAWNGQGYIGHNTIHDYGTNIVSKCCRLSNGDCQILCISLGKCEKEGKSFDLNMHDWMLHALKLSNGSDVMYHVVDESNMKEIKYMEVEWQGPIQKNLIPSRKRHDVPQIVRDNVLNFENAVRRQLAHAALDHLCSVRLMGQAYLLRVTSLISADDQPQSIGKVMPTTSISYKTSLNSPTTNEDSWKAAWDVYPWNDRMHEAGVAGYDSLVSELVFHLRLVLSMEHPAITSHGLLVQGVSGVGKTTLLTALHRQLQALDIPVVYLEAMAFSLASETNTSFSSTNEFLAHHVRHLTSHGLLLIDNMDAFFEEGEVSSLGRSILQLLDKWTDEKRLLGIVATTTSALPSTALRNGRLDRSLHMEVPTESMRLEICIHHLKQNDLAERLAAITGGYVAKDLSKIVRHATAVARRQGEQAPTWLEILKAQGIVQPSQLQDLNVQRPDVSSSWDQFAGYDTVKKRLLELVSYRFERKDALKRLGVDSVSGILLYGPSGCGKTMLIRGVAAASKANFVQVQSSKLMSKYFGETEKSIRDLFARARSTAPCILFFDELDSIAEKRSFSGDGNDSGSSGVYSRVLSTLLNEMDGIGGHSSDIIVMAATNRLNSLDAALIRPGRMDQALEIDFPSISDREAIFMQYTKSMPLSKDVDLKKLNLGAPNEMTGAEISAICKEAALLALRENEHAEHVEHHHFETAIMKRIS